MCRLQEGMQKFQSVENLLTNLGTALSPNANGVRVGSICGGYFADMTVCAMFIGVFSQTTKL